MRRFAGALVLVVGLLSLQAIPTHAVFTDAASLGSNSFETATLQPPTNLTATRGCLLLDRWIDLAWTATSSAFADGYDIRRSTTNGGPYTFIAHVNGRTTTTYRNTGLSNSTTYYYVVRATAGNWTSANSNQASATTHGTICL